MNANDKIYFEGIVLNEGAYFYSYYNNIDEAAKKKNINILLDDYSVNCREWAKRGENFKAIK